MIWCISMAARLTTAMAVADGQAWRQRCSAMCVCTPIPSPLVHPCVTAAIAAKALPLRHRCHRGQDTAFALPLPSRPRHCLCLASPHMPAGSSSLTALPDAPQAAETGWVLENASPTGVSPPLPYGLPTTRMDRITSDSRPSGAGHLETISLLPTVLAAVQTPRCRGCLQGFFLWLRLPSPLTADGLLAHAQAAHGAAATAGPVHHY